MMEGALFCDHAEKCVSFLRALNLLRKQSGRRDDFTAMFSKCPVHLDIININYQITSIFSKLHQVTSEDAYDESL